MGTTPRNEGEGNKTADRNYREATKKFVESDRGRARSRKPATCRRDEERASIERAEEEAKRRAKEHDPAEVRKRTTQLALIQGCTGAGLRRRARR